MQGLQHEDLDHSQGIKGGTPTLLPLGAAEGRLERGTKVLPRHMEIEPG